MGLVYYITTRVLDVSAYIPRSSLPARRCVSNQTVFASSRIARQATKMAPTHLKKTARLSIIIESPCSGSRSPREKQSSRPLEIQRPQSAAPRHFHPLVQRNRSEQRNHDERAEHQPVGHAIPDEQKFHPILDEVVNHVGRIGDLT